MESAEKRVLEDFRVFVWVIWKYLQLPDPTPVQYDIAGFLQGGPKRSVIEAFRGVGKSWLTSAFVCWLLLRDPDLKILVVSASKERADQFSTFVKKLINEVPILQHLKPGEGQRDSVISFDVGPSKADHSPSVKSVGITGQLTGSRADIIIADDVETPNNSATQIQRDKLSEAVKEFDAILKPLDSSRIIYLGTPQTEMSLYNQLPERGYVLRVWPAEYPDLKKVEGYKGRLAPFITTRMVEKKVESGDPTDPKRFDSNDLSERRLSYGRSGYALQFMLDTSLADADRYPLRISDLIVQSLNPRMAHPKVVWAADPSLVDNELPNLALTGDRFYRPMWHSEEMAEYSGVVMSIDPSGRGTDETGYAVVAHLDGMLFVLACGGLLGGYDEATLTKLAVIAKRFSVNHIVIEANFGDGMFTSLFKPVLYKEHDCFVEEVKHNKQKELRIIDTLEPVMSSHRLVIDRGLIDLDYKTAQTNPQYALIHQMTRLTKEKGALVKDDRLDALAIAVAYWVQAMAKDREKATEERKGDLLQTALDKFIQNVVGGKGRASTSVLSGNRAFSRH